MGLHKRHNAGRVFRHEAARHHLAMHKRDSHGDQPKMHVPEGFDDKQTSSSDRDSEAVSVVYVTLPQTFSGAAVYSTMGVTPTADGAAEPTDDASYASAMASYSSALSEYNAANGINPTATSLAVVTPKSSAQSTLATSLHTATTVAPTRVAGTPVQATRSASATATSDAQSGQSGNEMSHGAQAGFAIGIIAAIALVGGLVFFCWRRKRSTRQQDEMLNEKHGSFADAGARHVEAGGPRDPAVVAGAAGRRESSMTEQVPASFRSSRTASTAPRLSLRPVTTQFLPILGDNNGQNKNTGSNLDVAGAGKRGSGGERAPAGTQQNPFDDATAEKQASRSSTPPQNPFFDEAEGTRSNESLDATRAAGVAAGAAVMANKKHSPKSSWEGSGPATPSSARFGTAAADGSPRGPPPPRGPNNVHRVQLDFKPSMEDELELVSGQLVRMLHEYDDGWALCIRMDRSQQGVAPRTCLSKLPVKPRPQGPSPQGSRPGTSQGPPNRPSNSAAPNGTMHQGPIVPRPLTPSQATRSPSPTSSNGEASSSTTGGGPGKIERKPVPGQAM